MSRRRQFERAEVAASLGGRAADKVAAAAAVESRGPCPGRCNSAHRRFPEEVEAVPGRPVWCWACQERIVSAVRSLPGWAAELASMPGGRLASTGRTDRPARSTAIVSPSGSPAWDAVDEVIAWAWVKSSMLLQRLGQDPGPTWWTRPAAPIRSLTTSCSTLERHAAVWLTGPDAEADGRAALRLERDAETAAGRDRLVHRLSAPCPRCDTLTLVREDGEDHVSCRSCHSSWPEADYRWLVRVLADEQTGAAG